MKVHQIPAEFVPLRFCLECAPLRAPLRAPEPQIFLERAPLRAPVLWSALRSALRKSANIQVKFDFEKFQENFSKKCDKNGRGSQKF